MARRSQRGRSAGRSFSQNSIGDYDVGYGRPPAHSRFLPGQSGNPKGRPKRRGVDEIIQRAAYQVVELTIEGQKKRLPLIEVIIRRLFASAAKGDYRAAMKALELESWLRQRQSQKPPPNRIEIVEMPMQLITFEMEDNERKMLLDDIESIGPDERPIVEKYLLGPDAVRLPKRRNR